MRGVSASEVKKTTALLGGVSPHFDRDQWFKDAQVAQGVSYLRSATSHRLRFANWKPVDGAVRLHFGGLVKHCFEVQEWR